MAYRDELLAARSRLLVLERELDGRRAEAARLTAFRAALRDERRRLKRSQRARPSEAPEAARPAAVEERLGQLATLDARALEERRRAVEHELGAGTPLAPLRDEVERLVEECRRLRANPRAAPWPLIAGGLAAAGLTYLVVYSIFVWWLARVSLFRLT